MRADHLDLDNAMAKNIWTIPGCPKMGPRGNLPTYSCILHPYISFQKGDEFAQGLIQIALTWDTTWTP